MQPKFRLVCYKCLAEIPASNGQPPKVAPAGNLYVVPRKQGLIVHSFISNPNDEYDSIFDSTTTTSGDYRFDNRLTFLKDIPILKLAEYVDMQDFYINPASYLIPDLREADQQEFEQYLFFLERTTFTQP